MHAVGNTYNLFNAMTATDVDCSDCAVSSQQTVLETPSHTTPNVLSYNPLDPSTFIPPVTLPDHTVTIEFCDRVSLQIVLVSCV